ncbi:MAG: TAXI family TRAP transporter solute-binding subunit [Woeseiaceae bacterium]
MNYLRTARRSVVLIPIILILIAFIATDTVYSPEPEELRLVLPRLPIDRQIADEFGLLLDQQADVTITQVRLEDPSKSALQALLDGEADLAMVSNKEAFNPDIGTVIPMYPRVLHIAHRSELPTGGFESLLRDGTVDAGLPGSDSRIFLEQALSLFNVELDDVDFVGDDGCVDVELLYAPVSRRVELELSRCGDYKLRSLGAIADLGRGSLIDAIMLQNPRVRPFIIPRRMYGDVTPEPVVTLAVDQLLVAHESVEEAVVYDLMSEIQRLQHAIADQHPAIYDDLVESFSGSKSTFALHQGTQAFLERDEPGFMERYSGVAEVLVTLLVGIVSGGFAMLKIYQFRQKNRIDEFYAEILEMRDSVASGAPVDSESIRIRVRKLQDEALAMLIEEKLAGDESFRIFMSLSNDLIDELRT